MNKFKNALSTAAFALIIFVITYLLAPSYLQGQDRKKFIFRDISYYKIDGIVCGLFFALAFVGYMIYSSRKEKNAANKNEENESN